MDLQQAQKIINAYGKVLELTAPMQSYGVPESLLPNNKKEIKSAIKLHLQLLKPEDRKAREAMLIGYMSLAAFVPDEDAKASSLGATLNSGIKSLNQTDRQYVEKHLQVLRKIEEETRLLSEELQSLLPKNSGLSSRQ